MTDQQFRKPNTYTKSTILVHHENPPLRTGLKPSENNAFPCKSTRGYWYLLSLKKRSSKRETSILNLAAGGRRMESPLPPSFASFFLSLSPSRHLSAPVLDPCSTFHRSSASLIRDTASPSPSPRLSLMLSPRIVAQELSLPSVLVAPPRH